VLNAQPHGRQERLTSPGRGDRFGAFDHEASDLLVGELGGQTPSAVRSADTQPLFTQVLLASCRLHQQQAGFGRSRLLSCNGFHFNPTMRYPATTSSSWPARKNERSLLLNWQALYHNSPA
jgi:hypothetical protein